MTKLFPLTSQELMFTIGLCGTFFTVINSVTGNIKEAAFYSMVFFVVAIIVFAIHKFWITDENRFKLVSAGDRNKLYNEIIGAKSNIMVTHFSNNRPSETYIALLQDKMRKKVSVTRIISDSTDKNSEENMWLSKFHNKPYYHEKPVHISFMPFDVIIIDSKIVLVSFPSNGEHNYYTEGIKFRSDKVAKMFGAALDKISRYVK